MLFDRQTNGHAQARSIIQTNYQLNRLSHSLIHSPTHPTRSKVFSSLLFNHTTPQLSIYTQKMHLSLPLSTLLLPLLVSAWGPSDGDNSWNPSNTDNAWPTTTTEIASITTTYIAQTTVTMTLLAVQTSSMQYFQNATSSIAAPTAAKSSFKIDVSATPSVCADCAAATGAAAGANGVDLSLVAAVAVVAWAL